MTDAWSPTQYGKFEKERDEPFFDLLAGIPECPGGRAIDLGCGTGKLTRELHRRLRLKETLGVDSSPAMLAEAGAFAGSGVRFERAEVERLPLEGWDVIFSNAALQWVDRHESEVPRWAKGLAPGGRLAVQMPANHGHVSHTTAAEIASEPPFREALGGYRRVSPVQPPETYAVWLARAGLVDIRVQTRVYLHRLSSREEVVEWVRGTLLTDYQKRMPESLWPEFLERYRERLLPRLEVERPFLYPFLRTLFWASGARA